MVRVPVMASLKSKTNKQTTTKKNNFSWNSNFSWTSKARRDSVSDKRSWAGVLSYLQKDQPSWFFCFDQAFSR